VIPTIRSPLGPLSTLKRHSSAESAGRQIAPYSIGFTWLRMVGSGLQCLSSAARPVLLRLAAAQAGPKPEQKD